MTIAFLALCRPALAAEDIPVVGTGLCPAPDAVWQELVMLLPREQLIARLKTLGEEGASIRVDDLGASFRIMVLDKAREYREETRDCGQRARMGALFAALVIDPTALLGSTSLAKPPAPLPAEKAPEPAPAAAPAPPRRPVFRIEAGPTMATGVDRQRGDVSWGGALRLELPLGALAPVLGASAFLPNDSRIGGVRLRQWRFPMDLGVRATVSGEHIEWFGEIGLAFALLSERGLELQTPRSATAMEFGGHVAVGARGPRRWELAPFVSLAMEIIPNPPAVAALPVGVAGRTPYLWMGATVGVCWEIR